MSMFDDLSDPLGPPAGDALGSVLARAHRRRIRNRSGAAVIAVGAAVAVVVAANSLLASPHAVRVVGPHTTAPASTSTSTTATTTTGPVPTTTSTTTSTTQPAGGGTWFADRLTITTRSLGGVQVGMTLTQAQGAAGMTFDGHGDGALYPMTLPSGYPHLFVRMDPNGGVACFGAEISDAAANPQTVVTPDGFRLGDTVAQLKAIYGTRAQYQSAPSGGISPRAGYVVAESDGNLAFYVDNTNTRVMGIKGGGPDVTPSSCSG